MQGVSQPRRRRRPHVVRRAWQPRSPPSRVVSPPREPPSCPGRPPVPPPVPPPAPRLPGEWSPLTGAAPPQSWVASGVASEPSGGPGGPAGSHGLWSPVAEWPWGWRWFRCQSSVLTGRASGSRPLHPRGREGPCRPTGRAWRPLQRAGGGASAGRPSHCPDLLRCQDAFDPTPTRRKQGRFADPQGFLGKLLWPPPQRPPGKPAPATPGSQAGAPFCAAWPLHAPPPRLGAAL